jgi:hypothetical protein
MWLDPAVPVAPGVEKGVEKFKQRMRWRESGWCPIGIALHRTAPNVTVPFPTWSFSAAWMPAGSAIEILIARDDKTSPSFSIEPPVFAVDEAANRKIPKSDPKALVFAHPIAVERITAIGLVQPSTYQPVVAYQYLEKAGIFKTSRGAEWAIDVTFDGRRRSQTKDLRPELPMILHY